MPISHYNHVEFNTLTPLSKKTSENWAFTYRCSPFFFFFNWCVKSCRSAFSDKTESFESAVCCTMWLTRQCWRSTSIWYFKLMLAWWKLGFKANVLSWKIRDDSEAVLSPGQTIATFHPNISHPFATCCEMLGVAGSSLKMKFEN